jgi:hypothetical protein
MEVGSLNDDLDSWVILATIAFSIVFIIATLLCLKIKSTRKTPELLGTVGTVKPLQESLNNQAKLPAPSSFRIKNSPRLRPVSTVSDVIHDVIDGPNRTPSRAGERKLPDIPREANDLEGSDLYATVGSAIVEAGSESEEAETEPTEANHPYAKVKKMRDHHPYATVEQDSLNSHRPPLSIEDVDSRPQPLLQSQPQYFSGDSQDSSKGYTSISVREPLRHIRGPTSVPVQASASSTSNYAPVSEASDDMYAAIEDPPRYIPTGQQSNSDTYAVINLPDDEDDEEVALRSAHTYSQVDKSRKKKALSQPAHNVDDMYAKIQKPPLMMSPPQRGNWEPPGYESVMNKNKSTDPGYETVPAQDHLPIGASAMRTSAELLLGARPRTHHHHVNYSDYEVSHYDPKTTSASSKKGDAEGGYETVPNDTIDRSFRQRGGYNHEGSYERVEDYWRHGDDGYELVRGNSKRSRAGFERLTFSSSSERGGGGGGGEGGKKTSEPGYETVRDPPVPPLPRMINHPVLQVGEPPYARLENAKDEEESEEGYETIPGASDRRDRRPIMTRHYNDPGYESVNHNSAADKKSNADPGYETVSSKAASHEPGYETVTNNMHRNIKDPGYETVKENPNRSNNKVDPGYETVRHETPTAASSIHMSVRKTQSGPPQLLPRNNASVVVIEHKLAVTSLNNNVDSNNAGSGGDTTVDGSDEPVQSHIFV